jgi:hypothetical protein
MPTYTVKPGDSSFSIAGKTLDDQRAFQFLMDSNPQIDWANLKPGQTVNIPDPDEFSGVVTQQSLDNVAAINQAQGIGGATGTDFGQGATTGAFDFLDPVTGLPINHQGTDRTPRTRSLGGLAPPPTPQPISQVTSPFTGRSVLNDTGIPEGAPSPGGLGIGVNLPSIETTNNGVSNTIDLPSFGIGVQLPQIPDNFSAGLGFTGIDSSFSIDGTGLGINAPAGNFGLGANIPQPQAIPGTTIDPLQASIERNPINDLSATEQAEAQRNAYMTADNSVPLTRGFIEANGISDLQMIQNGYVKTAWGWQIDPIAQGIIQDAEAANGEQPISGTNYNTTPLTYYTGSVLGLGGGGGYSRPQSVSNPVADFTSGRGALINWRTGGF